MEQKSEKIEEKEAKNRRRFKSVIIHKAIQREFTMVVISLLIISALSVAFVIHYTIHEAMMGGGYHFGKISPYEVMAEVDYNLITRVSAILFITMLIIALFGVFFLHRIAGPVFRFHGILRRITRGEIPDEFKLREGDFFTDTAEDLNQVLKLLRERQKEIDRAKQRLEEILKHGVAGSSDPGLSELREILGKIA